MRKTTTKKPEKHVRSLPPTKRLKLTIVRTFLSNIAAKHRRHSRSLTLLIIAGVLGFGAWFSWELWHMEQVQAAHRVVASGYEGIKIESESFNGPKFHGFIAYAMTENKNVNSLVAKVANGFFRPCQAAGESNVSQKVFECNAVFNIDFATPQHMQLTYHFKKHHALSENLTETLLIERSTGRRLIVADLFKPNSHFIKPLALQTKKALQYHFGKRYKTDLALQKEVDKLSQPSLDNFANFALTSGETLTITYNQLSRFSDTNDAVSVHINAKSLYSSFNARTVGTFFPKLKKQKDAEHKIAEEAMRKAKQAEAARQKVRDQVASNRSNINCATMKCIALTFDDGPGAYTAQLVDTLRARRAVATFYVLGSQVAGGASALKHAVNNKNEVASHAWSHLQLTNLGPTAIASELNMTDEAIHNATGMYPKTFRPPYGSVDSTVMNIAKMPIVLWSVDTLDWKYRDPAAVYQSVIASASPGANILLHEIHGSTVQAMPRIIDELQRQGYVLVTVSEMFGINQQTLPHFTNKILRHR